MVMPEDVAKVYYYSAEEKKESFELPPFAGTRLVLTDNERRMMALQRATDIEHDEPMLLKCSAELTLARAEAEGYSSLLCDVQQDCVNAKTEERERIKHIVCCEGHLCTVEKYGHGFHIQDDLWAKIFSTRGKLDQE